MSQLPALTQQPQGEEEEEDSIQRLVAAADAEIRAKAASLEAALEAHHAAQAAVADATRAWDLKKCALSVGVASLCSTPLRLLFIPLRSAPLDFTLFPREESATVNSENQRRMDAMTARAQRTAELTAAVATCQKFATNVQRLVGAREPELGYLGIKPQHLNLGI